MPGDTLARVTDMPDLARRFDVLAEGPEVRLPRRPEPGEVLCGTQVRVFNKDIDQWVTARALASAYWRDDVRDVRWRQSSDPPEGCSTDTADLIVPVVDENDWREWMTDALRGRARAAPTVVEFPQWQVWVD